jgi:histidinol dehydrogenase
MIPIIKSRDIDGLLEKLRLRAEGNADIENAVKEIINAVKTEKDAALFRYTKKFDGADKVSLIKKEEIEAAYSSCDKDFISALQNAASNIYDYHKRQRRQGYAVTDKEGVILGCLITPIEKVGLYVPGGSAAYPSSVLMNAIPAKIAGVKEIIMVSPPDKNGSVNPAVLAAAYICGVDRIFTAGGAQSIAALAYGTETIPKVDKIIGPGNIYVATAKRLLFGVVDIDMIAGPSEILIIADEKANPSFIAADMMSQAEHDPLSSSLLLTVSGEMAEKVNQEINRQIKYLERKEIIQKSLKDYGAAVICASLREAAEISDRIAPEHLEIMTENPFDVLGLVKNAGSVFLGAHSPEPLGDYYSGTNHVLPTNGTARFFSALGVDSFVKKSGYTYYSESALRKAKKDITAIAGKEGLTAHANSINIRFENGENQ